VLKSVGKIAAEPRDVYSSTVCSLFLTSEVLSISLVSGKAWKRRAFLVYSDFVLAALSEQTLQPLNPEPLRA